MILKRQILLVFHIISILIDVPNEANRLNAYQWDEMNANRKPQDWESNVKIKTSANYTLIRNLRKKYTCFSSKFFVWFMKFCLMYNAFGV